LNHERDRSRIIAFDTLESRAQVDKSVIDTIERINSAACMCNRR